MEKDSKFTRDDEGYVAVRTVVATEATPVVEPDSIFCRDTDGNVAIRVVNGAGSGGGDQHNKGFFATEEALREAVPTADAGDWAIVGSTDTVWVWDVEGSDWVDTDTKGEVTPDMIIVKSLTMPSASTTPAGAVYQYIGQTNANYTHGYIYENVKTATYTGTVSFEAASLSETTVACDGDDFANFLTESGVEPLSVVSGTMTYDAAGSLWVLVGKNASDETVLSLQEYQEDYEDFGFTFTGTPVDGDVIAFTCTVEEDVVSYSWVRLNTQPVPTAAEIGAVTQAVHTISLVSTDWSSHSQTKTVSGVTADNTVIVSPAPASAADYAAAGILCTAQGANSLTFTCTEDPTNNISVNVLILN